MIALTDNRTLAMGRLPRAAGLTTVAALAANLLVYVLAGLIAGVPGEYAAILNPASIAVTTVGGVAVAAAGLALLSLLTTRAATVFRVVASVLLLLSLGGPLQALAGAMPGLPPATTATALTMAVLHLITGGAIAVLLPALARR